MKKEEKITMELSSELRDGGISQKEAEKAAEIAAKLGYRKERHSEWIKDTTYEGKSKDVYRCKSCDHYEAVKKGDRKIRYMRFCPACGALMKRSEDEAYAET